MGSQGTRVEEAVASIATTQAEAMTLARKGQVGWRQR